MDSGSDRVKQGVNRLAPPCGLLGKMVASSVWPLFHSVPVGREGLLRAALSGSIEGGWGSSSSK